MPQSPTTSPDAAPDPALEGAIDRLMAHAKGRPGPR